MDLCNVMMSGVKMVLCRFKLFDNKVVPDCAPTVPSFLELIAPILLVATEIENDRPRVAYLCRFYAFQKLHRLDQSSSSYGVGLLKMDIRQRLERDNAPSLASRVKTTDAQEIESFYKQYNEKHVIAVDHTEKADRATRAQLGKAYQVAGVLFEVLCAVQRSERVRSRT